MAIVPWALASLEMPNNLRVVGSECPWLLDRFPSIGAKETEEASVEIDFHHVSAFKECFYFGKFPVGAISGPLNNNCC